MEYTTISPRIYFASGAPQESGRVRSLFEDLRRKADRYGPLHVLEILQHNERLVSAIIRIAPALRSDGIEKIRDQSVRVTRDAVLRFKHTSPLKFSETLQFVSRQSTEKFQNLMSIDRDYVAKKGANKRRAGGDSGQI